MKPLGYVYKTENKKNGRVYIGQKRGHFKDQYLGSGLLIRKAIKKYGKKNFKLELIAYAKDQKQLDELEKEYIAKFKEICKGRGVYNIAEGGLKGVVLRGKKNCMFNSKRFGKKNPNWRGGVCSKKHFCQDCNKEVHRGSKRCKSCVGKLRPKSHFFRMSKARRSK